MTPSPDDPGQGELFPAPPSLAELRARSEDLRARARVLLAEIKVRAAADGIFDQALDKLETLGREMVELGGAAAKELGPVVLPIIASFAREVLEDALERRRR